MTEIRCWREISLIPSQNPAFITRGVGEELGINGRILHAERRHDDDEEEEEEEEEEEKKEPIPPYPYPIAKKGLTLGLTNCQR